eukprot:1523929-Pyramimonas_sp.AAC.1
MGCHLRVGCFRRSRGSLMRTAVETQICYPDLRGALDFVILCFRVAREELTYGGDGGSGDGCDAGRPGHSTTM